MTTEATPSTPTIQDFLGTEDAENFFRARRDALKNAGLQLVTQLDDNQQQINAQKEQLDTQLAAAQANLDAERARIEREKANLDNAVRADRAKLVRIKDEIAKCDSELDKR